MFKTAPVIAPPRDVGTAVPIEVGVVPLSHLSLDLSEPPSGWVAYLTGRAVAVVEDDLGRPSIPRAAARMLFDEHRADEVRKAEHRQRQEREAVEADRQWRAQLPSGVPWYEIPDGVLPAVAMTAAARDESPRKRSMVEDLLDRRDTMVFHPMQGDES
jgi:hypothetical protein